MNRLLYCILAALALSFAPALRGAGHVEPVYPDVTGFEFARTFPYSMTGQLLFENGDASFSGSGTVIKPSSIITAAHNLYDFRGGWSTDLLFRRALYGDDAVSEQYATRLYVNGGYRGMVARHGADHVYAFATDIGGARFPASLAGGGYVGWSTNVSRLTGSGYDIALGYGGEYHTGDDLLFVEPTRPFYQVYGAFYENKSVYIEPGMSGGPVFARTADGQLYQCGIVVSGASNPIAGGIRVFNAAAATFIRTYLR